MRTKFDKSFDRIKELLHGNSALRGAVVSRAGRTALALLLAASMMIVSIPSNSGLAEVRAAGTVCTHIHDADCGYAAAVPASPCSHAHNADCGYDAETGTGCTHTHNSDCGYSAGSPAHACSHVCGVDCLASLDTAPEVSDASDDSVIASDIAPVVGDTTEVLPVITHICTINSFVGNVPGKPLLTLDADKGAVAKRFRNATAPIATSPIPERLPERLNIPRKRKKRVQETKVWGKPAR